jgi:hypothetical protein
VYIWFEPSQMPGPLWRATQRGRIQAWYRLAAGPEAAAGLLVVGPDGWAPIRWTGEQTILETLGNLGDFVGGVAVVATLVYVALQIRQNTSATRAATFLGLTNAWQDVLLASARPEVVDLRVRAAADPDSVSESEYVQLALTARVFFRRFENDFFQYRSGTFDPGGWEGYRNSLTADVLASPSLRAFWEQQRSSFAPEFVAYVDAHIGSARTTDGEGLGRGLQEWRERVKRESAA